MRAAIVVFAITVLFVGASYASPKEGVRRANLLYNEKKYDEALKLYEEALSKMPASGIINFDIADSQYRKGSYGSAIESFNKAIASGDPRIIQKADYNIGNAQYRIGVSREGRDPKKSSDAFESALEYYKRAIDLDPSDRDAKFNYEFLSLRLKILSSKQSEQKDEKEKKEEKKDEKKEEKKDREQNKENSEGGSEPKESSSIDKGDSQNKEDQESGEGQRGEGRSQEGEQAKGQPESEKDQQQDKSAQEQLDAGSQVGQTGEPQKEEDAVKNKSAAGKEEDKKPEEEKGVEFYQSAEEVKEMSEKEAKMLLEGYRGEEATGRSLKIRRKPITIEEPEKNW